MKNIKFEKNGKIFNLKAIVCENKDLIKYMKRDYLLNLCAEGCPNYNTNWSCPPNSPRFDEYSADYTNSLLVQVTSEVEEGEEFMEAYVQNRNTLEDLLSKMQIDFECIKTACGSCNLCERCAFLDNKHCYHPEKMRYSMEAMGMDLQKMSEEVFNHKLTWNNKVNKSNICTSIGSILFNGTFLEDDFCDLARNYRF